MEEQGAALERAQCTMGRVGGDGVGGLGVASSCRAWEGVFLRP